MLLLRVFIVIQISASWKDPAYTHLSLLIEDNVLNSPATYSQPIARRSQIAFNFDDVHAWARTIGVFFEVLDVGVNLAGKIVIHLVQLFSGRTENL